ncbi:unnamed protein product [Lymnaea stagnalis]|uniref:VWFA domain-containing protein n=1 Tax=Lymnaea stagnalis TaxID=6523 RepID=A0AAV2IBP1_LYMST
MMLATTLCLSMFLTLFAGLQTAELGVATQGKEREVEVNGYQPLVLYLESLIRAIIEGLLAGLRLAEILLFLAAGQQPLACNGLMCDYNKCQRNTVADIVLLMDSSKSVGAQNWPTLLNFASEFTTNFWQGPANVQYAGITYSWAPVNLFDLETCENHTCIDTLLKRARFLNAQTFTDEAFEYISDYHIFDEEHGGRPDAKDFVVLFIQEGSSSPTRTIAMGQRLRDEGVGIIAVAIGSADTVGELYPIVNDPQDIIVTTGFDALHLIERKIVRRICLGAGTR